MAHTYTGAGGGSGATYALQTLSAAIRTVYSEEIYAKAMPILKFEQFATKRLELGVQPGKQITIMKTGDIARGGSLAEGSKLETTGMYLNSQNITVQEYANALGMSEMLVQSAFFDQLEYASMMLGRDYAETVDLMLRAVVCPAGIVDTNIASSIIYGNSGGTAVTDVTESNTFSADMIRDAVLKLQTFNAPKFAGDYYVCFTHPHCLRYLRKDPDWVNASYYGKPGQIFIGEVGRFEDVRFVASTIMPQGETATWDSQVGQYIPGYNSALAGGGSASTNLYKSCVFGADTYAMAVSLPVELRDDGVENFGRFHGLAWYSIMGAATLNANHNCIIYSA